MICLSAAVLGHAFPRVRLLWRLTGPAVNPALTVVGAYAAARAAHLTTTVVCYAGLQPTVILWGAADTWEPVQRAKEIFSGWSADFVELPGALCLAAKCATPVSPGQPF